LAFTLLACGFFNADSQTLPQRVVILTRLPTLTPTPLPERSDINDPAVIGATPAETPILPPEPSPTISSLVDNAPAEVTIIPTPENEPPQLTSLVALNVRRGPGTIYEVVGKLAEGQSTKVLGKNAEGTWWQIVYPPDSTSSAWVSAEAQYTSVNNDNVVEIAQVPPSPTPTTTPSPTNTPPLVPTEVPTTTSGATVSIQQTRAPRPTNTPLPPAISEIFQIPASMRSNVD